MGDKLKTKKETVKRGAIKYGKGMTKEEYREKYPDLALALEELFDRRHKRTFYAQARLSYEGHMRTTGERRTLTLQAAVDILESEGYTISIAIKPPESTD